MYVGEMHKQKWEFGEEFWNAKVTYGSQLHISLCTQVGSMGVANLESTLW
jgi:hypothetical protein